MKHHHFTDEEKKWLIDQDPELTYKELTEAFNNHFGTDLKRHSISDLMCKQLKVVSRRNNSKKGRFKKGAKAKYAIGTEVEKQGYVWVKVNDKYFPGESMSSAEYRQNWKRKADVVWEKHNGPIPEGKFIVFLDGNRRNCDIENLYLIDRKTHVRMAQNNWYSDNPNFTLCALKYCELVVAIKGGERCEDER